MTKSNRTGKILSATWLLTISLLILLISFTMGAWGFRHIAMGGDRIPKVIQPAIEKLAEMPSLIKQAAAELRDEITGKPSALLIPKDKSMQAGWVHKFPAPDDDGYLLLSGLSAEENQSIVQLIRIADGQVIAKWIPDWPYIHRHTTEHRFAPKGSPINYRALHPLLLSDGSIVFHTTGSLVRLPLCSSEPSWVLDYPYHHSIELSPTGNSVWAPSVTEVFATENPTLKEQLRDDSLSEVSLDGRILQNLSFSKILSENRMTGHMLGSTGPKFNLDPLHINQITPALSNGPYWQRGDLLISARHTSTIYLYRPTTGKIIWHQQGPWLNQHSAHFYGDHRIAVFGNDVYAGKILSPFIYKEGHNQVYLYDFKTAQTNKLQSEALSKVKPTTITEGRLRVLDDKSIFIEETNNGRLLKLNSSGQLMWSYINTYDKNYLGAVSWGRYLTHEELHTTINVSSMKCNK
jgi:outer membrane protein assembly factor BamB